MEIPMLLPGINVALSPTDYRVMKHCSWSALMAKNGHCSAT
jgi:hypothetical protein